MRYGIALVGDRVAPRCVFAGSILVVVLRKDGAKTETTAPLDSPGLLDLANVLSEARTDVLVCGGISNGEREFLAGRGMEIIDNVAGSVGEILDALQAGTLRPGFGLAMPGDSPHREPAVRSGPGHAAAESDGHFEPADCLACRDQSCMQGKPCGTATSARAPLGGDQDIGRMLEASLDVSCERERTLCRLSELIYFCLEMQYRRIGVAYCVDLQDATEALVRLLRRFFEVHTVCCKIGGAEVFDPITGTEARGQWPARQVACNPRGQAGVLNRIGTDVNVLVGLCIGTDCVFARCSDAPVTTLFVKDRSLANNPIGAVYSDYYLREAIHAVWSGAGEAVRRTNSGANEKFTERGLWRFRH
jgi:uncharacterized metal-binding protein